MKWRHWKDDCQRRMNEEEFATNRNLEIVASVIYNNLLLCLPPVRVGRHIVFPLASVSLCVCVSVGLSVRHKIVSAL